MTEVHGSTGRFDPIRPDPALSAEVRLFWEKFVALRGHGSFAIEAVGEQRMCAHRYNLDSAKFSV
jgi:hypothetical protein